mmetsp:Transcript_97709/g.210690  ORF Transcript_97709/g.210690 Transcript_97709/m.210690 type:complete len:114 (+) Transcript_97709:77-418(+)
MLDADESGEVDIDTFCEGITQLTQCGKPIEFFRILNKINTIEEKINNVEEHFESLTEMLGVILSPPLAPSPSHFPAPSPAGVRMSPEGSDVGATRRESDPGGNDCGDDADVVT